MEHNNNAVASYYIYMIAFTMQKFLLSAVFCLISLSALRAQTTGYSGTGANIDVDSYQCSWTIDPTLTPNHNPPSVSDLRSEIFGTVRIKFKTTVANVTSISLDLRSVLVIDNVVWQGSSVTPTRSGNIFSVPVNIPASGTRDSITITYHGFPPFPSGDEAGYNCYYGANENRRYIVTSSESYEDRDWWPCKADMQDKADTVDMAITVPWNRNGSGTDTFWVAANGTLIDSAVNPATNMRTFKYINRYPIASYLVAIGISRYKRYYRGTIPAGGFNVPVVYYVMPVNSAGNVRTETTLDGFVASMDKATECLSAFGQKFGDYPFPDPGRGGKHGYYEGCPFGGMEHQTFSAISQGGLNGVSTLIHELAHQWWGDKVTFATWRDLWLAEGWGQNAPSLATEMVSGLGIGTAQNLRTSTLSAARSNAAPARIPSEYIDNSFEIWAGGNGINSYGRSVYVRGGSVWIMLRTLAGDDKFFSTMKGYMTRPGLAYASATTDSVANVFRDSLGVAIDSFFNDYVIGSGYPNNVFNYKKYGAGNRTLGIQLMSQSQINSGFSPTDPRTYFSGPSVIRIQGAGSGDTTIVIHNWSDSSLSKAGNGIGPRVPKQIPLVYQLSFEPVTFTFNPFAQTLAIGSVTENNALDFEVLEFTAKGYAKFNAVKLLLDANPVYSEVILERSGDGIHFTEIGEMVLQASTGVEKKYIYNDAMPLSSGNFYRAKYKNGQGIFLFTKIIRLGENVNAAFSLMQNPVREKLRINTAAAAGKEIYFSVTDAIGRIVKNHRVGIAGNITEIILPQSAAGAYFVTITVTGGETKNLKFIVQCN